MKKKHIILDLINTSKGGAGKSIYAWLRAEKYPDAFIIDMDDSNESKSAQLSYREPIHYSILNSDGRIDRDTFDAFIDSWEKAPEGHYIADMGAATSQQFLDYITDVDINLIDDSFKNLGVEVRLFCIINGGKDFSDTMAYLKRLIAASKGHFEIIITYNRNFKLQDMQNEEFEKFCEVSKLKHTSFNIVDGKSQELREVINSVLLSGNGISGATGMTSKRIKKAIDEIEF